MLKHLEVLCQLPGVSGREDAVREYILEQVRELADEVIVGPTGSVIALKKGERSDGPRMMVSAHMDEVGLIVTRVCDDGMLKFSNVGGIDPRVLCGRTVLVGEERIPGVIGVVPIHLSSGDEKERVPKISAMTIDIGAQNGEEAKKHVRPGDVCVFDTAFELFGDGLIKAKALDDRAGCAIMLELMKQDFPGDVYFTFVTMEEVGLRGATCAAYTVAPDYALVLESTTAADIAGVDRDAQVCRVREGAVISFMDRSTIYDRELFARALDVGREKGIAVQVKEAVAGGNDAGAIHKSRGGVRTLAISLPCRYLHAPASLIAKSDLDAAYELAFEMISEITAG